MLPGLGFILLIVFGAEPSTPGRNRYGLPDSDTLDSEIAIPSLPPPDRGEQIEKLEKLAVLRSSGTIDDGEFLSIKAKIMDGQS
jgi:hypothetical protein